MLPIVLAHLNGASGQQQHSSTPRPTLAIWNMWNQQQATTTSAASSRPADLRTSPAHNSESSAAQSSPTTEAQGGCFATADLPRNCRSQTVSVRSLRFGQSGRLNISPDPVQPQLLRFSHPAGSSEPATPTDNWLAHARLADDVQSNNAICELHRPAGSSGSSPAPQLRVRLLRDMAAGDELLLWFNEELLALLSIPFLAPINIRGQNAYTCTKCSATFEYPNPLKIHLATECGRQSQAALWRRVVADNCETPADLSAGAFTASIAQQVAPLPATGQLHQLQSWLTGNYHQRHAPGAGAHLMSSFLMQATTNSAAAAATTVSVQPPAIGETHRNRLPSAFQPLPAARSLSRSPRATTTSPAGSVEFPALSAAAAAMMMLPQSAQLVASGSPSNGLGHSFLPVFPFHQQQAQAQAQHHHHQHQLQLHQHQQHLQQQMDDAASAAVAAAHLETIVSNMGSANVLQQQQQQHGGGGGGGHASGGGHMCLYCGKLYSRKYGLKIHIRTHTGFKPLKCPHCARPFGDPSNMNKHIRLHVHGNTIYHCPVAECDKILVRRRDLQRHIQTQHMLEADAEADKDAGSGEAGAGRLGAGTSKQLVRRRRSGARDDRGDVYVDVDGDDDGDADSRDGQGRAKRSRSELSSPLSASSGASSPSFVVDDQSDDD